MVRPENFKQRGPRDQATVILAAIEGGLDNIKDSVPTNIENLFNRIEEMKFLLQYLPTEWRSLSQAKRIAMQEEPKPWNEL